MSWSCRGPGRTWNSCSKRRAGIKGRQGDIGPMGEKGSPGLIGPKGDVGSRGEKGDSGGEKVKRESQVLLGYWDL